MRRQIFHLFGKGPRRYRRAALTLAEAMVGANQRLTAMRPSKRGECASDPQQIEYRFFHQRPPPAEMKERKLANPASDRMLDNFFLVLPFTITVSPACRAMFSSSPAFPSRMRLTLTFKVWARPSRVERSTITPDLLPVSVKPPEAVTASSTVMGLFITRMPGRMTSPITPILALLASSSVALTFGSIRYSPRSLFSPLIN